MCDESNKWLYEKLLTKRQSKDQGSQCIKDKVLYKDLHVQARGDLQAEILGWQAQLRHLKGISEEEI